MKTLDNDDRTKNVNRRRLIQGGAGAAIAVSPIIAAPVSVTAMPVSTVAASSFAHAETAITAPSVIASAALRG